MKAWHFVGKTLRDGRPIPKDGEKLVHHGEVILCKQGLHASIHPFDALKYAPGTTLCLVECAGEVKKSDDKLVCSERTIIARMDFSEPLRYFARMQALSVIHLWEQDPPDVVLDWLMTGGEGLRKEAAHAAYAAAYAAANAAAYAAANAADAAAYADYAATYADYAATAARDEFEALVNECFEGVL
jgi:hypothetical protein